MQATPPPPSAGMPHYHQQSPSPAAQGRPPRTKEASPNLFVAGLDQAVDDNMLIGVFSRYGKVVSAKVMVDLHTGKARGFGFVLFESAVDASAAMQAVNGTALFPGGLRITIEFSTVHSVDHLKAKSDAVYVRNIPRTTAERTIVDYFNAKYSNTVRAIEILPDTAPGATDTYVVAKMTFVDAEIAAQVERETQRSANVFAASDVSAPPLLAKLAERPSDRARRIRNTRVAVEAQRSERTTSTPPTPVYAPQQGGVAATAAMAQVPPVVPVQTPQHAAPAAAASGGFLLPPGFNPDAPVVNFMPVPQHPPQPAAYAPPPATLAGTAPVLPMPPTGMHTSYPLPAPAAVQPMPYPGYNPAQVAAVPTHASLLAPRMPYQMQPVPTPGFEYSPQAASGNAASFEGSSSSIGQGMQAAASLSATDPSLALMSLAGQQASSHVTAQQAASVGSASAVGVAPPAHHQPPLASAQPVAMSTLP